MKPACSRPQSETVRERPICPRTLENWDLVFGQRRLKLANTAGARVNIHSFAAQKTDQRLAAIAGKFRGEAARRGNGGNDRNTRGEGFLHHFKRRAATEKQDVPAKRQIF